MIQSDLYSHFCIATCGKMFALSVYVIIIIIIIITRTIFIVLSS